MEPWLYPDMLLHPKQIDSHECLSSGFLKYGNCAGRIWTVWKICKDFPAKLLQCSLNILGNMWAGIIVQQDDAVCQHSWVFGRNDVLQILQSFMYHCALIVMLCFRKSMSNGPLQLKKKSSWFSWSWYTQVWILFCWGWIYVLPLLSLTLSLQLSDDTMFHLLWQYRTGSNSSLWYRCSDVIFCLTFTPLLGCGEPTAYRFPGTSDYLSRCMHSTVTNA